MEVLKKLQACELDKARISQQFEMTLDKAERDRKFWNEEKAASFENSKELENRIQKLWSQVVEAKVI